ncbi:hypothetical protein ACJIZ3_001353 [Penstemon smallii]|uniref:C2 domain-containing protein n=1 Tax=Penstemon smallii TaxID=265156 RepID=A0ABD3U3R4_9LAMI
MEYRPLNISVISAEGIKDMNVFAKMDVYTEVSLAGYPKSKKRTFVDKDCGTSPKWNHHMEFVVDEPYLTKPGLSLVFQLMAESAVRSDKEIGSVTVPVDDLFQGNSSNEDKTSEYQVRTASGKAKGTLKFAYNFGEKFTQQDEKKKQADKPAMSYQNKHTDQPVTAYPAGGAPPAPYPGMGYPPQYQTPPPGAYPGYPPQQGPPPPAGYGYQGPPPPAGYGGGYPAQPSGYGYQPPPPGYGYPPGPAGYPVVHPPAQKPHKDKKKKSGMGGLGMGLGAGLLGGLLIGEMASDIADMGDMGDF